MTTKVEQNTVPQASMGPPIDPPGGRKAPIENSYWVPGTALVAGEYPGHHEDEAKARKKIGQLLDAGIGVFIDLTEPADAMAPYEGLLREEAATRGVKVQYVSLGIPDMSVPTDQRMHEVLDAIDRGLQSGRAVYVHCWGGVGRTGTVIGCYLVRHGRSCDDALAEVARGFASMSPAKVRKHHEGSPQTTRQREFVRRWKSAPSDPLRDRYRGCLLGGAVGDALGAPVEFRSLAEIRRRYGPEGIADFDVEYGRKGAITDDTQMTLFTAEGVLRASTGETSQVPTVIYHAYLRWLRTQGVRRPEPRHVEESSEGLIGVEALHQRRAPGNTCLGALQSGRMGSVAKRINDSKGCGGVMRAAPVGLSSIGDPFELGCESAAITHGHPSGYLAAGCLALMIRRIIDGASIAAAVREAIERVEREPGHEEVSKALRAAVAAAAKGLPTAERVEALGKGWVAEEALAIAAYCALVAGTDFERGVRLAVNHGGDSDSTGAIAGNLLGARLGVSAIPKRWLEEVELKAEIEAVADDLLLGYDGSKEWTERYPPN